LERPDYWVIRRQMGSIRPPLVAVKPEQVPAHDPDPVPKNESARILTETSSGTQAMFERDRNPL
jgi:hypothetical protein